MPPRVILLGAGSGIGIELAKIFAANGYELGITAVCTDSLKDLARNWTQKSWILSMDLRDTEESLRQFNGLLADMGKVDIVVYVAGVNTPNPNLVWEIERDIMTINVLSFIALANAAMRHFSIHGKGHLAAISSIAGRRGGGVLPSYYASKACMSIYLDGLRQRFGNQSIFVTDIRPGFVKTAILRDPKSAFWVSTPEKAAAQIFKAISDKRKVAYVTKRWRLIAYLLHWIPDFLYDLIHGLRRRGHS